MEYFVQRIKHKADGSVEERAFSHAEDGQRQGLDSPSAPQPGDGLDVAHAKPLLFDDLYKKSPSKPLMFNDLYKKPPSKPLMFNDLYRPWSRKDHRGRDDATHRPLHKYAWVEAEHPRDEKGQFIAFLTGVAEGARTGLTDTLEGLGILAEAGGSLLTDPQAWVKALETSGHVAEAAYGYGKVVADDPAKPFRDVRDGALSAYSAFDQAHSQAVADDREAEFWGKVAGRGVFEFINPVGKAAKIGN